MAVLLLLVPTVLALAAAALSLATLGHIPVFLPFVLLLWLPVVIAAWTVMVSVRTSPSGIAAARPWRTWAEIPWNLIERVERRGTRVKVQSSDGRQIAFLLVTLHQGTRLHREILMRLPMPVLDARLRADARDLLGQPVVPLPEGGLSGVVHAQPQPRWRWAAGVAAGLAFSAGVLAALLLPTTLKLVIALPALGVLLGALGAFAWLGQRLILSEQGISVSGTLGRRASAIGWTEILLIEHTPSERVLRLRGDRRLRCAGPGMLRPTERDLMRAFLHAYCLDRGVPIATRRWLW